MDEFNPFDWMKLHTKLCHESMTWIIYDDEMAQLDENLS
jgi:hypothetical protein